MTRDELVQISKLMKILIEREVQRNVKPLLSEIKTLNNKISNLLAEQHSQKPLVPSKEKQVQNKLKFSINDILGEITESVPSESIQKKTPVFNTKKSPLMNVFEDVVPFDEEGENVESVLDYMDNPRLSESNDPVAKVLNKLQNTDFKRTLEVMEQSANRFNTSQMNR